MGEELNWIPIVITASLSFIGAFLGTYISFVFKKKEKKYEYNLELEKRIINELSIPIFKLDESISNFKKFFQIYNSEDIADMILSNNTEILALGNVITNSSEKISKIINVNTYYLNHKEAEIILNETKKALLLGFYCEALLGSQNESSIVSLLEESLIISNDYNSEKVHSNLPKLF